VYQGFALFLVGAFPGFAQVSAILVLEKRPLLRYRSLKSTKVIATPLIAGWKICRHLIPGSSNSSDTGGRENTFLGGIFGASFLIKQN